MMVVIFVGHYSYSIASSSSYPKWLLLIAQPIHLLFQSYYMSTKLYTPQNGLLTSPLLFAAKIEKNRAPKIKGKKVYVIQPISS